MFPEEAVALSAKEAKEEAREIIQPAVESLLASRPSRDKLQSVVKHLVMKEVGCEEWTSLEQHGVKAILSQLLGLLGCDFNAILTRF